MQAWLSIVLMLFWEMALLLTWVWLFTRLRQKHRTLRFCCGVLKQHCIVRPSSQICCQSFLASKAEPPKLGRHSAPDRPRHRQGSSGAVLRMSDGLGTLKKASSFT